MRKALGGIGRGLAGIGLLLTIAGAAWGQDPAAVVAAPDGTVIAGWLRSGDPRVEAWGAVWALREGDRSFLRELTEMAARWEPLPRDSPVGADGERLLQVLTAKELDRQDAMAAVLDGVIGMQGEMPAEVVERFAEDFPAQAVVLLARMPARDRTAVLERMFREGSPELRRPAASMLALAPPEGFAAELLQGTTVRVKVWVSLPGDLEMGSGSSSCCGAGSGERPVEGWPEVGQYKLVDGPERSDAAGWVVVPGVRPIVAVRSLRPHIPARQSRCGAGWLTDAVKLDLLAEMLGRKPAEIPVRAASQEHLVVANEGAYRSQLARLVIERERGFAEVAEALAAKGLMAAEETGARPRLLLMVVDGRSRQEFPLEHVAMPEVAWVDGGAPESVWFDLASR